MKIYYFKDTLTSRIPNPNFDELKRESKMIAKIKGVPFDEVGITEKFSTKYFEFSASVDDFFYSKEELIALAENDLHRTLTKEEIGNILCIEKDYDYFTIQEQVCCEDCDYAEIKASYKTYEEAKAVITDGQKIVGQTFGEFTNFYNWR